VGARSYGSRGYSIAPRAIVGRVVPRIAGRVGMVAPYRFARPYYTFRPRVSLGFGLWLGFPVAYPYYYYAYPSAYPSAYASPYPYPYRVSRTGIQLSFVRVSAGELSRAGSGFRRRAARTA
jgi:hypothetical protein